MASAQFIRRIKKVKPALGRFTRTLFGCRLGILLLTANMCLIAPYYAHTRQLSTASDAECVTLAQAEAEAQSGNAPTFCYSLLPKWVLLYVCLNLPAGFLADLLSPPLPRLFPQLCVQTARGINEGIFLLCSALQWLLIGSGLEWVWRRWRRQAGKGKQS